MLLHLHRDDSLAHHCNTQFIENLQRYESFNNLRMTSERFVYTPLSGSRQIRLLKIHSVLSSEDPKHWVELIVTSLDTAPKYVALSYSWGDPLPKTDIYCSGYRLAIGSGLHKALRYLWPPATPEERPLYLWADAVCINQENIAERNAQVRIMSDVHATATTTTIWLGEEDEYLVRAFNWLTRFRGVLESIEYLRPMFNSVERHLSWDTDDVRTLVSQLASNNHQMVREIFHTAFGDHASLDTVFRDIWMMLNREWFTRKWVLQEVCKSSKLNLVAGHQSIPWTALNGWFVFLELNKYAQSRFHAVYPGNIERENFQNYYGLRWLAGVWSPDAPLVHLLMRTWTLECSDPKDHVFALSSIASDFDTFEELLDYELSVEQLSDRLTRACLARPADLVSLWSSLFLIPLERRPRKSWVPDLQEIASLGVRNRESIARKWNRDLYESAHTNLDASPDGNLVRVKGRIVDVIEELGTDISASVEYGQFSSANLQDRALEMINFLDKWIEDCYGVAEKVELDLKGFHGALFAEDWLNIQDKERLPTMRSSFPSYQNDLKKILAERNRGAAKKLWGNLPPGYVDINITLVSMVSRLFGRTQRGVLGWMPKVAERGDCICILDGIGIPYAIRKKGGDGGTYALVGECFISGLEACPATETSSHEQEIIVLE